MPDDRTVRSWLAEGIQAVKIGNTTDAVDRLDEVLRWRPSEPEALLYRGQIAHQLGDGTLARNLFAKVPDEPARFGSAARYAEGIAAVDAGDLIRGETLLRRAIDLNPSLVAARERLVELYALQLRRDDLRAELDAVRHMRPWRLEELNLYSVAGERINTADEGIRRMRQAVAANPHDSSAPLLLARYLTEGEQFAEARTLLEAQLAGEPTSSKAAGLLAEVKLNQDDLAGALLTLARISSHSEPDKWYFRSAGRLFLAQGEWQLAAESLSAAVRLDPEDLTAVHQLGIALSRLRSDAATPVLRRAELLDRVVRESSRIPGRDLRQVEPLLAIVLDVAEALYQLERFREAAYWYDQALILDPRCAAATRGLKDATANFERAMALAEAPKATPPAAAMSIDWPALVDQIQQRAAKLPAAQVAAAGSPATIRLADVHAEAGVDFQYFNGQTGLKYLVESMGGGVAVLDYDCDGWPDLYLVQGCALPYDAKNTSHQDKLYRNLGDGRFSDVTAQAGLGDAQYGQGCAVGDYDNDGDPDLFVANFGRSVLYRNNGDGTFDDVTTPTGLTGERWASSAGFADLDKDGSLDLYVSTYVTSLRVCRGTNGHVATCDPGNFDAEQDRLYHNSGDGKFIDVTESSGIVAPDGKGLGVIHADLDNDSWTDIYIANDGTPNHLFKNCSRPGTIAFQEMGLLASVAVSGDGKAQGSMGIACADFENDGDLDLYVTNFINETYVMYRNLGGMFFEDVTRRSGTATATKGLVGFGVQPIDFDLDGRPELLVANGHIDDFRFRNEPWKMPSQLFQNLGDCRFKDISTQVGPYFQGEYLGRGVARVDWDRDGDDDAVIVHQDAPAALLRNDTVGKGNWIAFELHGVRSARDAIGARIEVVSTSGTQILERSAGDGFFSSNEGLLRIGLGSAVRVERAVIRWPSGETQVLSDPAINQTHVLVEGHEPQPQVR
jgi:tetratricopeptide (TPR) repeat protein